jgi:hypothetical protein
VGNPLSQELSFSAQAASNNRLSLSLPLQWLHILVRVLYAFRVYGSARMKKCGKSDVRLQSMHCAILGSLANLPTDRNSNLQLGAPYLRRHKAKRQPLVNKNTGTIERTRQRRAVELTALFQYIQGRLCAASESISCRSFLFVNQQSRPRASKRRNPRKG